jgi:hypothetical protein
LGVQSPDTCLYQGFVFSEYLMWLYRSESVVFGSIAGKNNSFSDTVFSVHDKVLQMPN